MEIFIYTTITYIIILVICVYLLIAKSNRHKMALEEARKTIESLRSDYRYDVEKSISTYKRNTDRYDTLCKNIRYEWKIEDNISLLRDYKLPTGQQYHFPSDIAGIFIVLRRDCSDNDQFVNIANIYPYTEETKVYARNCAEELVEKLNEFILS